MKERGASNRNASDSERIQRRTGTRVSTQVQLREPSSNPRGGSESGIWQLVSALATTRVLMALRVLVGSLTLVLPISGALFTQILD